MRRLLPLVGVLFAITSTAARAQNTALNITGIDRTTAETCWISTAPNLEFSWGGGPIGDCPGDMVQLDITGQILLDAGETMHLQSDDGVRLWIDDQLYVDAWYPRSCWGNTFTGPTTAGWHTLRVEFFEDYGGACLNLWHMSPQGWKILGPERYGPEPEPPTTTTEPATTSTSTTTTSEPAATTTTTSTTEPPPTTTRPGTTTTAPAATTTTAQPLETSTIAIVSTTTQPSQQTAPASTSQPPTTLSTSPTSQITTTSVEKQTIIAQTSTSSSLPDIPTTTTVAPAKTSTGEALAQLLTKPLDELAPAQAAALFDSIREDELTDAQAAALVAAVQTAPPEIRAAFEDKVNIFAGIAETYVPLGSKVPVRTRRIIIITTGLLVAMPPARRRP